MATLAAAPDWVIDALMPSHSAGMADLDEAAVLRELRAWRDPMNDPTEPHDQSTRKRS